MARNPKFEPPETPEANYNQGVINWAFATMVYDKPVGPSVGDYDPYYRYTVDVLMNGQNVRHTWFVNVDDHKSIQLAGAAKGTMLAVTAVKSGKRTGLVVMHSSGPSVPRTQAQVDQEVAEGLAKLSPAQNLLPPAPPQIPQPPTVPQPPGVPQQPAAPQPSVPPPQPSAPPPLAPSTIQPPAPPVKQQPKQQAQRQAPPPQNNYSSGPFSYTPMTDEEFEAWCKAWDDNARCTLYGYHRLTELNKEMEYPKITPTNVRELATNVTIETWRHFGKGRSPLRGAKAILPPLEPDTREHAVKLTLELDLDNYRSPSSAIVDWLKYIAGPEEHIKAWQHAGSIIKLFGVSQEVLIDEFDPVHLVNLMRAAWLYQDSRNDGMTRNESLHHVAEEFDWLPEEEMQFEDESE